MVSLLAGDNLKEVIYKSDALIKDQSFRAFVSKCSDCSDADVDAAFRDSMKTPEEVTERLVNLHKLFKGLTAKLPKREYKRVQEEGDMEDPKVDETIAF